MTTDDPAVDLTELDAEPAREPVPTGDAVEEMCLVCPHPRADHDAISRRFCAASAAGGGGRGCVCRTAGKV